MPFFVLTGTPGSGKTALLRALELDGVTVVEEAATDVIALNHAYGRGEPENAPGFLADILALQLRRATAVAGAAGPVFLDRSPVCTLALARHLGLEPPAGLVAAAHAQAAYGRIVFFVRNLGFVERTPARRITFADALRFERIHEQTYRELGFDLVDVPAGPLGDRLRTVRAEAGLPPA
jgi:predicted ATPase